MAAQRLCTRAWASGAHRADVDGDYADVANGYLELYLAAGELSWLEEAQLLARHARERFGDPKRGGFFIDDHGLVARRKGVRRPPSIEFPEGRAHP